MEELQKLPLHRSLTRPFLLMEAERELALLIIFTVGTFVLTYDPILLAAAGFIFVFGLAGARMLARKDPMAFKTYLKYREYKPVYEPISKTKVREEAPISAELSSLLPWGTLITENVSLNKDGSLTAAFAYAGKDMDSSTVAERNLVATQVKDALTKLGSNWTVQVDIIRVPENYYPARADSHFNDKVSLLIEEERRINFQAEGNHYITSTVLTLTYTPPIQTVSKFEKMMVTDKSGKTQSLAKAHLKAFESGITMLTDHLSLHLSFQRLGCKTYIDEEGNEHLVSNLLQYLNYALTDKNYEIEIPTAPFYIDSLLSYNRFHHQLTPAVNGKFIGCVSLVGFPSESMPNMLRALDTLPFGYRIHHRFIAKDAPEARKIVKKTQSKWQQKKRGWFDQVFQTNKGGKVNENAALMETDGNHALTEIDTGLVSYGFYNCTIVVRHEDAVKLDYMMREIILALQGINFDGFIEEINATDAFFGTLPGECLKNIRRPIVSSWNLTHLITTSSVWSGRRYNPCPYYPPNSPPLMYAATSGYTPLRINLHSGDIGHTAIIGPTGAGKSTLASMLQTQFSRYPGSQIFVFDKGRSAQPIIEAMGGEFYNIGSDKSDLEFYPLSNVNGTTNDMLFCIELLEAMVMLQGDTILPEDREEITRCLKLLSDQESKTLTDFLYTTTSRKLKTALSFYERDGGFPLLSGPPRDIPFHHTITGFEMGELMEMGEKAIVPVLLYMFHEIKKRLDGRPSYIHLAEAWTYFKHSAFKNKIQMFLKELRKKNCIVVMDTQSLSDVMKSGIMSDIQDSCSSKIYLPNVDAMNRGTTTEPGPYECYKAMGLNDTQIMLIRNAVPKRDYYLVHREGNRIFTMALGPIALSFVGATGLADLAKIEELKGTYGEEWPFAWMDYRGVDYRQIEEEAYTHIKEVCHA